MSALRLFAPMRLARLVATDAANVGRDPMLLVAVAMSLLPPIALHFARDTMDSAVLAAFGIAGLSQYVLALALLLPAVLIGWVTGFLLLEERDEGTLLALDVTPVGKSGFLAYRVSVATALTTALTLYAWPLVMAGYSPLTVLAAAILVGADTIVFAAILPAIARNKVEGLALTKLSNLLMLVPLAAAIPSPWRFVAGIFPTYWIGEVLGLNSGKSLPLWLSLLFGCATAALAISVALRMLAQKAG